MVQTIRNLKETASQTAGPFVHIGLLPALTGINTVAPALPAETDSSGPYIGVSGRILDGAGEAVRDALIEFWHAGAQREGGTEGNLLADWGRTACDFETGVFRFETARPGPQLISSGGAQAPHVNLFIIARGINTGLHTRMYLADEEGANDADPVLDRVVPAARRATLIARLEEPGARPLYAFDIRLQGADETVFFDI